jgi:hypothetical protein
VDTFPNSDSDKHSYFLTADPYSDKSSATLDKINCYFLIVLSIFNSTYSAWNSEPVDRFSFSILFDILVGLHFIVNLVFVVGKLFA